MKTSATVVTASIASIQEEGPSSTPRVALHDIRVMPVPIAVAKSVIERHHYLHSLPGATHLAFGAFLAGRLLGSLTIGAGPSQAHQLVEGAKRFDCAALTRLWLSHDLPRNSESKVIGTVLRALKRNTSLRFLVTYADPVQGHVGTIYQATNWIYTGLSAEMQLYDLGDGILRQSRTVGHVFGSHSVRYLADNGIPVNTVAQPGKHRYIYFLDHRWRARLRVPVLPYPKA